jgi:hypothetical protein
MRVEYHGKRTAELAGVTDMILKGKVNKPQTMDKSQLMNNIVTSVMEELAHEMSQHRLPAQLVLPAVLEFSKDLMEETKDETLSSLSGGQKLGGPPVENGSGQSSARELALAAAEKRARNAKNQAEKE